MSLSDPIGDMLTRIRNGQRAMRFRGREMAHQELGMKLLHKVRDETEELAKVEQHPKMEGRQMTMVIAPTK